MLSTGEYWRLVPRDPAANVRFRRALYARMRVDPQLCRGVRELCRRDFAFFVNAFVWQFNPRQKGGRSVGPFVLWGFQVEAAMTLLDCVEHDRDIVIEKSREMGASWLCLLVFLWMFLYRPWQKFLCISRSADAVEDDDPDSLFWKLDFVLRYLPGPLVPPVKRRKMFFLNEENQSTITGQASTGRAGVGGRATAMLVDEFSQIKEDTEVQDRTSDTTGCRIFNGTHIGVGTAFYRLTVGGMKKLVMHWTEHPDKRKGLYRFDPEANRVEVIDKAYVFPPDYQFVTDGSPRGGLYPGLRSPWYDEQCGRKTSSRAIAMDLDIDPQGSVSQFFNALVIRKLEAKYAVPPVWEGDLVYDKDAAAPVELVRGDGGPLRLWASPDREGKMPAGRYAAGADIATGNGATPTCMSIVNSLGEKVGEYTNPHITAESFGVYAIALCRVFATKDGEGATFIWESVGPGLLVTKKVLEFGYGPIHWRVDDLRLARGVADKPGWYPSPAAKAMLLEEYRSALEGQQFVNRSSAALQETLKFFYTARGTVEHGSEATGDDDPTAARSNHGDHVIADALAWKVAAGFVRRPEPEPLKPQSGAHPGTLGGRRALAELHRRRTGAWA